MMVQESSICMLPKTCGRLGGVALAGAEPDQGIDEERAHSDKDTC